MDNVYSTKNHGFNEKSIERQESQLDAICKLESLTDAVNRYGAKHEFTKLIPDLTGVDPDDSFSTVPYVVFEREAREHFISLKHHCLTHVCTLIMMKILHGFALEHRYEKGSTFYLLLSSRRCRWTGQDGTFHQGIRQEFRFSTVDLGRFQNLFL